MRTQIYCLLVVLFFLSSCTSQDVQKDEKVIIQRITNDKERHQAFTDLVYFDNQFFLTFRESDKHDFGNNGVIKLMSSKNGKKWTLIKEFNFPGIDLRDPKFAVNGDDLLIYIHGSTYENKKIVAFSDYLSRYSSKWDKVENVVLDNKQLTKYIVKGNEAWPWRVTWHNNKAYVFGYNGLDIFGLYKSEDGLFFKNHKTYSNVAVPCESTIRVNEKGEFYALTRRIWSSAVFQKYNSDTNELSMIGVLPFVNFGGPNFLFLNEKKIIFAGGRGRVILGVYDLETNESSIFMEFGGGDCSYPGMVIKDDVLWLSYYSSHETQNGASIYVAEIQLKDLLE